MTVIKNLELITALEMLLDPTYSHHIIMFDEKGSVDNGLF
jgi:hypothetical protein